MLGLRSEVFRLARHCTATAREFCNLGFSGSRLWRVRCVSVTL